MTLAVAEALTPNKPNQTNRPPPPPPPPAVGTPLILLYYPSLLNHSISRPTILSFWKAVARQRHEHNALRLGLRTTKVSGWCSGVAIEGLHAAPGGQCLHRRPPPPRLVNPASAPGGKIDKQKKKYMLLLLLGG